MVKRLLRFARSRDGDPSTPTPVQPSPPSVMHDPVTAPTPVITPCTDRSLSSRRTMALPPYTPWRRSRRGGVKLGCFLAMAVLGIGGWAGMYVGEAYWKYYQYADAFKQEAKFAGHYTDRQIKQHLRSMADSLVLPDDAYEIVVERGRHHIVIDNQYYAHVNMGVITRDFFFNPHAEADF